MPACVDLLERRAHDRPVTVAASRPAILGATTLLGALCSHSRPGAQSPRPMPTPRKALQCELVEGVFTMTLAHGTDWLESAHPRLLRSGPVHLPVLLPL